MITCFQVRKHINGLVQDYSISIVNALEILHPCTKPSICWCDDIYSPRHGCGFQPQSPMLFNTFEAGTKWPLISRQYFQMNFRLKLVPNGPVNKIPALVPIMAWRRPGAKSLYEPSMVILPTHIFVTRPQWVNEMDIIFHFPAYRSQGPIMHHTIDCDVISRNKTMYALLWRPLYALTWLLFWYIYIME